MGKIIRAPKEPQRKVKCIYRAEVEVLIRNVDLLGWEDFIEENLPETYSAQFHGQVNRLPVTRITLMYEAAGANTEDIRRRLRTVAMHHIPLDTNRTKTCGCPEGTVRCVVRTND
jgi:hypothetical protein